MSEANKAIARREVEEAFSKGNLDVLEDIIAPDYVSHDPGIPEPIRGLEGVRQLVAGYRQAFPDLQVTIEDQIAEGERVVTRWSARGTHQGDLWGIAPTGKQATVTGISIERIVGGKIVEDWTNWDTLGLMQQLGVVPAMARA